MGAAASGPAAAPEVWPPDWDEMDEDKRRLARKHILELSARTPDEFMAIANSDHAVPAAVWRFEEYHAAAAAAVQEDIKLNKIIYKLVPRKLEEGEFWRLYFSEVLFVLDSVKAHGQYPPPPPPPPAAHGANDPARRPGKQAGKAAAPAADEASSCAIM